MSLDLDDTKALPGPERAAAEADPAARLAPGLGAELPTVARKTYEVDGEVGRGGLGRILKARDARLGRHVAIKELLPGNAGAEARFVREALVTARLEHPGIVPVHEAGRWPDGAPFYAMKLVSGRSLLEVIKGAHTLVERLALLPSVIAVAEAVGYAHSRRVIHRDIKPANVIVGQYGETVVIDWGVAKELDAPAFPAGAVRGPGGARTSLVGETMAGDIVGTPAYMPPEQAMGARVDERTDVYALGALLYHVLCGRAPYGEDAEAGEPFAATQKDSAAAFLKEIIARPPVAVEERQAGIPEELVTIVAKAMARAAGDRYPSAKELAEDLKRFQTGKLVTAHQYTFRERARRWMARYRAVVAVAAVAGLVVAAVGLVSLRRVLVARRVAEQARVQADRRSSELLLLQAHAAIDQDPTASIAWLLQYPQDGADWSRVREIASSALGRGVATHVFRGHGKAVDDVSFSPDEQWIASASADRTVRLWEVATGRSRLVTTQPREVAALAFSPDGARLATGGADGAVVLWEISDKGAAPFPSRVVGRHDDVIETLAFGPDGSTLASGGWDGTVRLWDLTTSRSRVLSGHTSMVRSVAFSPDGAKVASASDDQTLRIWDARTGEAQVLSARHGLNNVSYSADGTVVRARAGNVIQLFSLPSGVVRTLDDHLEGLSAAAWSPDGRTLALGGYDGLIHLWDTQAGRRRTVLTGFGSAVNQVAFSPSGRHLVAASYDRTLKVWPVAFDDGRIIDSQIPGPLFPAFSRDGRLLVAGSSDGGIRVWSLADDKTTTLVGHEGPIWIVSLGADSRTLVSTGVDHTLRQWDLATGSGSVLVRSPEELPCAYLSPDSRRVLYCEGRATKRLLDLATHATECTLTARLGYSPRFSRDGQTLVYNDAFDVRLADLATCTSRILYTHDSLVYRESFSPDGRFVAAGADTVSLFELASGELRMLAVPDIASAITFSPDGSLLAAAAQAEIVVWDVPAGHERWRWRSQEKSIHLVLFSPDGRLLVTYAGDRSVRVWALATGDSRVFRFDADVTGISLSADGAQIAVTVGDGTARLLPADPFGGLPTGPAALAASLATVTTVRLGPGNLVATPSRE